MSEYYNVTTNAGDAAIATAIANNNKLNITHVAFGDGNGSVPTPNKTRSALVHEVHRQAVTKYSKHPTVANYIVIETIIPSSVGGFWIREMGIIADNVLISHGSHAPFYKVADPEGVGEYRLKFTQDVRDGSVVQIVLDESLIYASQAWVNENYIRRNELVDNLTTNDATKPLTAKQGKKLQDEKVALAGGVMTGALSATELAINNKDGTLGLGLSLYNGAQGGKPNCGMYFALTSSFGTHGAVSGQWSVYFNCITSGDTRGWIFQNGTTNVASISTSGVVTAPTFVGGLSGNAATATKLATARSVSFSGAATGSFSYDGSANSSCILTLANSGVTAGTYSSTIQIPSITVNDKGQITGISQQNIRSASVTQTGVVQLNNTLTSSATDQALTAAQGKYLQDYKLNKVTSIPANSDLNTYLVEGFYACSTNAAAASIANVPLATAFSLLIELHAGVKQTFTDYSSNRQFVRRSYSNVWSEWCEIAYIDSTNINSAAKLTTPRKINNVSFDGTSDITIADTTKLPLAGGTITGNLTISGNISFDKVVSTSSEPILFLTGGAARGVRVGSLLVSNSYSDDAKVPTNGAYIKGAINTDGTLNIGTRNGAKDGIFNERINLLPPSHSGVWNVGIFDDSSSSNFCIKYSNNSALKFDHNGNFTMLGTVTAPTFVGRLSGNSATATKLATARTISATANGMTASASFDGTANINLTPTFTTQAITDNSTNIATTAFVQAVNTADTGSSATAVKLKTARTIGGVSFDGTANINLPGVNAAGNQNTTGNAATATKLATARTITLTGAVAGSASFDGSANISIATVGLGVGQTWQNVTSSRVKGTTYTNTTGSPIYVAVNWEQGNSEEIFLYVDTLLIGRGRQNQSPGGHTVYAIIPNGSTYSISGGNGITSWMELR